MPMTWDEPTGATSPRGWAYLAGEHKPCGWYLDYGPGQPGEVRGPDGAAVLAHAYHFADQRESNHDSLGFCWFWATADAKAWIERAVALHLESKAS